MNDHIDLFEEHEWLGQFWAPGSDHKFAGLLKYSPAYGVQLKYLILPSEEPWGNSHIHGIIDNGNECTLFGEFSSSDYEHFATRYGTTSFRSCVIGAHISPESKLKEFRINLSSLQEFLNSDDRGREIPFCDETEFKYQSKDIEIGVISEGKFDLVRNDFGNRFHSKNKDQLIDIRKFFKEIEIQNFPGEIGIKKESKKLIKISKPGGIDMWDGLNYSTTIYNLFSLLLFRPVRPVEISAIITQDNSHKCLRVLKNIDGLNEQTINFLKDTSRHFSIKPSEIKLESIFEHWFTTKSQYDTFVPKLANTFRTYRSHELKGSIIMLLTQLEHISKSHKKNGAEKYDFPIKNYNYSNTTEVLASLLKTSQENIGKKLSALRGELAHIGRGKAKILESIPPIWLVGISICLDIVIASHIFHGMKINKGTVRKFQERELKWPQAILEQAK